MSQINIHNYEAYLLDYSEGNLSDELQMELELFLIQHPELDIDLSDLSPVSVEVEQISFTDKQYLKKTSADLVSETQFIAYVEDQLSSDGKLHVEKSCLNDQLLAKELTLYQHTVAVADTNIVYPNKAELKRKAKIIWFDFTATQFAAAASVLFVIGLFIFWPKSSSNSSEILVATNDSLINKNGSVILPHEAKTIASNQLEKTTIQNSKKENKAFVSINKAVLNSPNNDNVVQNNKPNNNPVVTNKEGLEANETISKEALATNTNTTYKVNTKSETIVEILTENEEDVVAEAPAKKKKGLWSMAEKTLRNLNNLGVKAVDGEEDKNKNTTAYALTLGGLNITHKTAENL
jgi:hypothetical protein